MARFHFHLRARGSIYRDLDGTELADFSAARAHGLGVAEELMRHSGADTRLWSICVDQAGGESRLELFFADFDPWLAGYSPQVRMVVSDTCRRLGVLTEALCAAQAARTEARMLLARARGKPQLVYASG